MNQNVVADSIQRDRKTESESDKESGRKLEDRGRRECVCDSH